MLSFGAQSFVCQFAIQIYAYQNIQNLHNLLCASLLSKYIHIKIYRTIILLIVLYGCKTWSLSLKEKRRLRVFENRAMRKIFGPKRDEVTGK